jgi:hypothetical protein
MKGPKYVIAALVPFCLEFGSQKGFVGADMTGDRDDSQSAGLRKSKFEVIDMRRVRVSEFQCMLVFQRMLLKFMSVPFFADRDLTKKKRRNPWIFQPLPLKSCFPPILTTTQIQGMDLGQNVLAGTARIA